MSSLMNNYGRFNIAFAYGKGAKLYTADNEEYPILFDIDDFITLDKFQELLNKSSDIIEKLININ